MFPNVSFNKRPGVLNTEVSKGSLLERVSIMEKGLNKLVSDFRDRTINYKDGCTELFRVILNYAYYKNETIPYKCTKALKTLMRRFLTNARRTELEEQSLTDEVLNFDRMLKVCQQMRNVKMFKISTYISSDSN